MMCPKCMAKTRVYGTDTGLVNKRYRKCVKCGYSFMTKEMIEADLFSVEYLAYLKEIGEVENNDKEEKKR